MSNIQYYTAQEAQQKMFELFTQGKGILSLKDDPKCPLDIKQKLQTMAALHNEVVEQIMLKPL